MSVETLIEVIDRFKKPRGADWKVHKGDIVINAKKWRDIKEQARLGRMIE